MQKRAVKITHVQPGSVMGHPNGLGPDRHRNARHDLSRRHVDLGDDRKLLGRNIKCVAVRCCGEKMSRRFQPQCVFDVPTVRIDHQYTPAPIDGGPDFTIRACDQRVGPLVEVEVDMTGQGHGREINNPDPVVRDVRAVI